MTQAKAAFLLVLAPSALLAAVPQVAVYEGAGLYDCGEVQVRTFGTYCVDADSCPYEPPVMREAVTISGGGVTIPIAPLAVEFPNNSERVDVARHYRVSSVDCVGPDRLVVVYWGGGNCSTVCEVPVEYRIKPKEQRAEAALVAVAKYAKKGAAPRRINQWDKGVFTKADK